MKQHISAPLRFMIVRRSAQEREEAVEAVAKKMPKRVKRKRPLRTEDGAEVGALNISFRALCGLCARC